METLPHDPLLAKCQGGMNSIGRLHWLQSLARRKFSEPGENPAVNDPAMSKPHDALCAMYWRSAAPTELLRPFREIQG
ncbi:hypothetical protein [Mesorhizobium sp. 128a]